MVRIEDPQFKILRGRLGGLTAERNRLQRRLENARLFDEDFLVRFYQGELERQNRKIDQTRFDLVFVPEVIFPPEEEEIIEVGPPEYQAVEYTKYYKYLPKESYKRRHFEIRAVFTIPSWIDPQSDQVLRHIELLLDNVMYDLGIEVGTWEQGWTVGGEETGEITRKFNSSVNSVVHDKLRGYVYRHPNYPTQISIREDDLHER